jgi:hypothetical protein
MKMTQPAIPTNPEGFEGLTISRPDGTQQVLYTPTPKQLIYHTVTYPNVLFWGGRGSGKSMCGRWDAHIRALAYPGFTYCILRRTFPELQRSHLVHIDREMKMLGGYFHHQNKIAYYPNGSQGFFSQCQSEEDVLKLLSAEFALMVFDELSTFEWEMFTKLSASVRVPIGSGLTAMVRGLTNPLGPSAGKIVQYFVDKSVDVDDDPDYNPNDWYAIKANLEDNPYIDQSQYRKRFSGLPQHVRKAWVDGEFVLENALFDFHPVRNGKPYHVVPDLEFKKIIETARIYRTIDIGWFPDPSIVLWIAHLGNRHIVLNEKIWYKTVAADIARDIKAEDERLGIKKVIMTYCDPTLDINTTADVRTIMEIFQANGIPMEKSINNREMYSMAMHNVLNEEAYEDTPRLQIFAHGNRGCPYLVKTIPQMRFDDKHPERMADHKEDHAVVALCYYLMSHASDITNWGSGGGSQSRRWMKPKKNESWILGHESVKTYN